MREWFKFQLAADASGEVADVFVYDYIGDWLDQQINEYYGIDAAVTAKGFLEQLAKLPESVKTIRVRINSPGGDVFAAIAISNALRDQRVARGRTVETIVEGLAASAASLIAMAGAPARMADNGLLMIHNPWTVAAGSAAEMRKAADDLDRVTDGSIIPTYQWHTSLDAKEIRELLDAETWMDANEAITMGFVDEPVAGLRAAASIDPRAASKLKVPERYAARVRSLLRPEAAGNVQPSPQPAHAEVRDVLRICRDAGLDIAYASDVISDHLPLAEVQARVDAERDRRAVAAARDGEIRALCEMAGLADLAGDMVAGGMTADQARAHLTRVTAKLDRVEIDAGISPDHGARRGAVIDVQAWYAERNGIALRKE